MGFIYIAWDRSKPNLSKVGMTEQTPENRISQTENPDYELYKAYKIAHADIRLVEKNLHTKLANKFNRRRHRSTSRKSEWFECSPLQAVEVISDYLLAELSKIVSGTSNTERIQVSTTSMSLKTSDEQFLVDVIMDKKLRDRPDDIESLKLKRHFNRKYIIPNSSGFEICSICEQRETRQVVLNEHLCPRCLFLKYPELKGKTVTV
ncbi:TPA: GIY-YIG nuclease family protein [Vibrio cholerae]|nr:GIY-YIG nuclease family protein [Vibrio cholerae]